jgi:hypothetical protein
MHLITGRSKTLFATCFLGNADLRTGMGFLARWFKFQPSEIDALEVDEFRWWIEEGVRQQKAEADAMKA